MERHCCIGEVSDHECLDCRALFPACPDHAIIPTPGSAPTRSRIQHPNCMAYNCMLCILAVMNIYLWLCAYSYLCLLL